MYMKRILFLFLILLMPLVARADTITFSWDAVTQNTDGSPVVGSLLYRLYISSTAGTYTKTPKTITSATLAAVVVPTVGKYFAVVTAYNASGESAYSNEVTFEVKPGVTPPKLLPTDPKNLKYTQKP